MQEITSFTLKYDFKNPEIPPKAAANIIAAKRLIYQGIPKPTAKYKLAPAPTTYCPATPILKSPTLFAKSTDNAHINSADAFTNVVPKYFLAETALE